MIILAAQQIENALSTAGGMALTTIIILVLLSLGIFSLYVAVGTYVVKKVWFSNWGGNPRRYR